MRRHRRPAPPPVAAIASPARAARQLLTRNTPSAPARTSPPTTTWATTSSSDARPDDDRTPARSSSVASRRCRRRRTHKLDRICRKLDLGPGDHVLEIGTGWGGFAVHAARTRGCRVTTTTISAEQHALAVERVARRRPRRSRHRAARRLPRAAGDVRQARLDRDDRGGRLARLRHVLRRLRASCWSPTARWPLQAITVDDRLYDVEKASRTSSASTSSPTAACRRWR